MHLRWVPATRDAVQAIDISPFANDFYSGTYEIAADLAPGAGSYERRHLAQGVVYHVRVRTLAADAWIPSATLIAGPRNCPHGDDIGDGTP